MAKPGAILEMVMGKGKPTPDDGGEAIEGNAAAEDAAMAFMDAVSQNDPAALVRAFQDLTATASEAVYDDV